MSFMGDQDWGSNQPHPYGDYDTSWSKHAKTLWLGVFFLLAATVILVFVK